MTARAAARKQTSAPVRGALAAFAAVAVAWPSLLGPPAAGAAMAPSPAGPAAALSAPAAAMAALPAPAAAIASLPAPADGLAPVSAPARDVAPVTLSPRGIGPVDAAAYAAAGNGHVSVIVALDAGSAASVGSPAPSADEAAIEEARQRVLAAVDGTGFRETHRYARIPAIAGRADRAALDALARAPGVVAVSVDPVLMPLLDRSAAFIGADKLRRAGVTGRGANVAVLDTGVDTGSVDLRDGIVAEACFIDPASLCPPAPHVAEDADGHGTMTAHVALSRGKKGAFGIAPGAGLIAVKLIEERNNAAGTALLAAFDWILARDDVDAINMSFGSGQYEGACDRADAYTISIAAAVASLRGRGVLPVAASGNDGSSTKMSAPACVSGVVSVGAIEGFEPGGDPRIAQFTNRNATLDLLAPGSGIQTTTLAGRTASFSGTSAASPHVAGAAALLRSAVAWAGPDEIELALESTADRPTIRYGGVTIGTIRVDRALEALRRMTPPPSPTGGGSPTRTATPAATRTATAGPTISATRTVSPGATSSASPTATAVATTPAATAPPTTPPVGTTAAPGPTATEVPTRSASATSSATTAPTGPAGATKVYLPLARRGPGAGTAAGDAGDPSESSSLVVAGPVRADGPARPAGVAGRWLVAADLGVARAEHTATLLPDGRVLVTGGSATAGAQPGPALAEVEIYEPRDGRWTATVSMGDARARHSATPLRDGRVLVVGGRDAQAVVATTEVFDGDVWRPAGTIVGRIDHTATLLADGRVLVAGGTGAAGAALSSAELFDPVAGRWSAAADMASARTAHAAALLPDGRVLVAGGAADGSAEVFDPSSGRWAPAGRMSTPRAGHTATLVSGGHVIVAGGANPSTGAALASVERFDPAAGTWSAAGVMLAARAHHTASLAPDGSLLVVAGDGAGGSLASVERRSPSGAWSEADRLGSDRTRHTATVLADGRMLVAGGATRRGGVLAGVQLYDPSDPAWAASGAMARPRTAHPGVLLTDGRVLVVGGEDALYGLDRTADVFDPGTGAWSPTGRALEARSGHSATLLPDGRVLVTGGDGVDGTALASAELYDPAADRFAATGAMSVGRREHTATLLQDGRVIVAGGYTSGRDPRATEIYDPATGRWSPSGSLNLSRHYHSATLLPDGRVLVVGGQSEADVVATTEVFDPATGRWTSDAPMATRRWGHTATLLADGRLLVAGGTDDGFNSLSSSELYDPAARTWTPGAAMTWPRREHVTVRLDDGRAVTTGGWDSRSPEGRGWLATVEAYDTATGRWSPLHAMAADRVDHVALVLLDGRVLVAGGYGARGVTASSERLDLQPAVDAARRPVIESATSMLAPGARLELVGTGFRNAHSTSGGNGSQDSPAAFPILQLASLSGAQTRRLQADGDRGWTDTRFTTGPISGFPPGHARVTLSYGGVPSPGRLVFVVGDVRPTPTAGATVATPPPTPTIGPTATPSPSSTPGVPGSATATPSGTGPASSAYLPATRRNADR